MQLLFTISIIFLVLLTGSPGTNKSYLPKLNFNLTPPILNERHNIPNFNRLFVTCSNFHPQNITRCDGNLLSLQSLRSLALIFFFHPHILVYEMYFESKLFNEICWIDFLFLDISSDLHLLVYFKEVSWAFVCDLSEVSWEVERCQKKPVMPQWWCLAAHFMTACLCSCLKLKNSIFAHILFAPFCLGHTHHTGTDEGSCLGIIQAVAS